jgi:hypothetical protein
MVDEDSQGIVLCSIYLHLSIRVSKKASDPLES